MSKHLISRVIMLPDGSAHIALLDRQTIACTPVNLSELLSDPLDFMENGQFSKQITTKTVNPSHNALEHIKGLTLLRIYSDAEISCVFPKLFHSLFESIGSSENDPLNLTNLVTTMDLSDEKHFLMKFFYDFTNEPRSQLTVKRKLGVEVDVRNEIMTETFNAIFAAVAPEEETSVPDKAATEENLFSPSSGPDEDIYISRSEFAAMHDVPYSTVQSWLHRQKLRGVVRRDGKIYINKNSPIPEDGRRGRSMPPRAAQGLEKYETPDNTLDKYAILQAYIRDTGVVSPEIAEFFRTYEELQYYVTNRYHEVNWGIKRALIIDIQPDYFSEDAQMTNRELILKGKSPRVPGRDKEEFHLHHIGQKANSPFAIIPKDKHLSNFKLFHSSLSKGIKPEKEEELHNENYHIQKVAFWKYYLKEYDKTGFYRDISSSSLWTKRTANKKNGKNKSK